MNDDDFTILAVPVPDPVAAPPTASDASDTPILPFAPPVTPEHPSKAAPFFLRGYDSPGDEFQPRLRSNSAA